MTCREFIDFLMDYLDGQLPADQRAVFDAHMAECPACVDYLNSYRQSVEACRAACECADDESLPEAPEQLVQAILAARRVQMTSD
jgi:anti-sigma factor RsiW